MLHPKCGSLASARDDCAPDASSALTSDVPVNLGTVQGSPSHFRHLTMAQHSHNLLVFLNEDRSRQKFCDVTVLVGGKVYRAHKAVLAHGSSYFHAELSKSPATTTHVTLDHVEDSVFQHLLRFLYTAECVVSETELPALSEAARFLDMMDILKLLCEDEEVSPDKTEKRGPPQTEVTSCDSAVADRETQSSSDAKYNLFNSQFTFKISRQDSSAEITDLQEEASTEGVKTVMDQRSSTTRRSARRRRTPTQYKRDDLKYNLTTQEQQRFSSLQDQNKGDEVTVDGNETSRPAQGDDVMDEDGGEDERGDIGADGGAPKKAPETSGADKSSGKKDSRSEMTEQQLDVHVPAAGSSNQYPVYPEGLAPVIIHTSSKKTLKCPKCEKTFDRAGEAHSVTSRVE